MNKFGQESPAQAVLAPASSQQSPLAWDRRTWLVAIPLALLVTYAFVPILDNGFAGGDDDSHFLDNPYFRGLGAAQMKWAWTTTFHGAYQPLSWLLYETQYVCCQLDPRGYHLTSLFLHVANAGVLYVLTVALLVRCWADCRLESPRACSLSAGLATALFAVHPLRVEAVAGTNHQPFLCCALFCMLAILAYLRAFRTGSSPRWSWLVSSFSLFVTALLFRPQAVGLPIVLLILDVYPLRRLRDGTGRWFGAARRILLEKVPFVIVSLLFMGIAIAIREQAPFRIKHYDVSEGIAQACYGTWFYILKTVWPMHLVIFYALPVKLNWLAFPYNLSILATLAMTAGLFLLRQRWPGLLAAWLSYLVLLAPVSGLIRNNPAVIAADRYSYIAMLGLVMPAAVCFCRLWRISAQVHPTAAIGTIATSLAALLVLVPMTRNQCRTWINVESQWTHVLTHAPEISGFAHLNLGGVFQTKGNYQAAKAHFTEALRLNPRSADAHYNFGVLLYTRGKREEAAAHFSEALRFDPAHDKAHYNLGVLLYTQGKREEAAAHFSEALRFDPRSEKAHNDLGNLLYNQGKHEEAVAHFTEALQLNPNFTDAHYNLGVGLQAMGRYPAAEAHLTEAIRLRSDFADAHKNLGFVLYNEGKFEPAATRLTEALRLHPDWGDAHNSLGTILSRQSRYAEAEAHFAEAVRLDPGNAQAHYNLGLCYSHIGKYEAALAQFAEGGRLGPGEPNAYNASALIMAACPDARLRDGKKAVELATRACELTQWKNPVILDTRAAAQAEAGDFEAAVESQKKAIDLLQDERRKDEYRSRLALYQGKKPYRQGSQRSRR